jgi:uncharacterized metal-binding protein
MITKKKSDLPLVYACSGCSNLTQFTNDLAVVMDREGYAQMSCILGVGNNMTELVTLLHSGRPIMAIDGCSAHCVKRTLALHNVEPTWHIDLTTLGLEKMEGTARDYAQMSKALKIIQALLSKSC